MSSPETIPIEQLLTSLLPRDVCGLRNSDGTPDRRTDPNRQWRKIHRLDYLCWIVLYGCCGMLDRCESSEGWMENQDDILRSNLGLRAYTQTRSRFYCSLYGATTDIRLNTNINKKEDGKCLAG
jgi:hypothetical protein